MELSKRAADGMPLPAWKWNVGFVRLLSGLIAVTIVSPPDGKTGRGKLRSAKILFLGCVSRYLRPEPSHAT